MTHKVNYHRANICKLDKINKMIERYPKNFSTPKYLSFIKTLLDDGWEVRMFNVGPSKYIFVAKHIFLFKIRFSNHKPTFWKETHSDCDFYVGVSHKQVSTTENIIKTLKVLDDSFTDSKYENSQRKITIS